MNSDKDFRFTAEGLPHSDIVGSKAVCASPTLIAAYHVLHRLQAPNHPPMALSSLTKIVDPLALQFVKERNLIKRIKPEKQMKI